MGLFDRLSKRQEPEPWTPLPKEEAADRLAALGYVEKSTPHCRDCADFVEMGRVCASCEHTRDTYGMGFFRADGEPRVCGLRRVYIRAIDVCRAWKPCGEDYGWCLFMRHARVWAGKVACEGFTNTPTDTCAYCGHEKEPGQCPHCGGDDVRS